MPPQLSCRGCAKVWPDVITISHLRRTLVFTRSELRVHILILKCFPKRSRNQANWLKKSEPSNARPIMTSSNLNIFRVTPICAGNSPVVRGLPRSPVNTAHEGQWRGALMFSLICAWRDGWVNSWGGWWFETSKRPLWRYFNALKRHCLFAMAFN